MSIRVSAIDPVQRERLTLQLLKHWDAACRGGDLPAIGNFDFKILERLGSNIFLLTIDGPDRTPVFRYVGRDLSRQVGRDLTGQLLSEVPRPSLLAHVAYQYLRVTAKRRPVALKGSYSVAASASWAYRGILLPFSENGDAVTTVLGSFQCDSALHHSEPLDDAPDSAEQSDVTIVGVVAESSKAAAGWIATHAGVVAENSKAAAGWIAAHAAGRASKALAEHQRALLAAARSRAVGPGGLDDRLKLLPTLGRVVLAHAGGSEFALLLARRMDDDPTQYEVVEVNSPITLLAFALHRYFRSAWWPLCQRSPARTAQTPIDCASQRWAGHKRIEPELGWPSDELRAQEERRPGAQADRGSIATRQSVGNAPEASRTDSQPTPAVARREKGGAAGITED